MGFKKMYSKNQVAEIALDTVVDEGVIGDTILEVVPTMRAKSYQSFNFIANEENVFVSDEEHAIADFEAVFKDNMICGLNYYNENSGDETFAIGKVHWASESTVEIKASLAVGDLTNISQVIWKLGITESGDYLEITASTIDGTEVEFAEADELSIERICLDML